MSDSAAPQPTSTASHATAAPTAPGAPAYGNPAAQPDRFASPHRTSIPSRARRAGLPTAIALCWIAGIALAPIYPHAQPWIIAAALAAVGAAAMLARQRARASLAWASLALICLGGAWANFDLHHISPLDLRRFLPPRAQLAQLTGIVEDMPRPAPYARGQLTRFAYREPGTFLTLRVESIHDGQPVPARGRVLVRIRPIDERPRPGERIRVTGHLSPPPAPANPGEHDARETFATAGYVARINVRERSGWQSLDPPGLVGHAQFAAARLASIASDTLREGMTPEPARLALLDALLLGLRSDELVGLDDAFREVGLAHALAISGAHFSVLLGLVWVLGRIVGAPRRVALVAVFAVMAAYLLVVPLQVPLIRAAIMAAALCLGQALGRRVSSIDALALAAFLVLVWRPADLYHAGFQLSFGVVAAMLLFAQPCARWILPSDALLDLNPSVRHILLRAAVAFLATNIVATAFAFPLVAYHFGTINPLGPLVSLPALPLVSLVMSLGFFKMLLGLPFPSLGLLLAWALDSPTAALARLVEWTAASSLASLTLARTPSPIWTLATLGLLASFGTPLLAGRRAASAAAILLAIAWLVWPDAVLRLRDARLIPDPAPPPALRLDALAVGDGSCFLLRLRDRAGTHNLLFDCGSLENLDVGMRSVVPALHAMNVRHIDTLVISHADLDHFGGSLDVADRVPIGRVLTTRYVLDAAARRPASAVGALVAGLHRRRIPVEAIGRGWRESHAGADLEMLWPPPGLVHAASNDTSLVLAVRVAGRRALLNGDIQQPAISALLESGEPLAADITDLPHHGSFVDASPAWLRAVSPRFVLQSSGPQRLLPDRWANVIDPAKTLRLITDRRGMVSLAIDADGAISWHAHLAEGIR